MTSDVGQVQGSGAPRGVVGKPPKEATEKHYGKPQTHVQARLVGFRRGPRASAMQVVWTSPQHLVANLKSAVGGLLCDDPISSGVGRHIYKPSVGPVRAPWGLLAFLVPVKPSVGLVKASWGLFWPRAASSNLLKLLRALRASHGLGGLSGVLWGLLGERERERERETPTHTTG